MNIRTKKTTTAVRKRPAATREAIWSKFDILFFVIILGLGIFTAISLRLKYSSQGVALSRETEKIRREIHNLERELEFLTTQREALTSWSHIQTRIAQFRLPLQQPKHNQVYSMTVNYEDHGLNRIGMFAHQTADTTTSEATRGVQ